MRSPFDGLTDFQKNKLFILLGTHIYPYKKNQEILPTIKYDNIIKNQEILPTIKYDNIIAIVLDGLAEIVNIEYNGNETIKEKLEKNSVFGTNISGTNYEDYQIIAKKDTTILVIDYDKLINPNNLNHNYFNIFYNNLFDIINVKFKEANERIRILEKKQIRDKLLDFFEIEHKKTRQKNIYLDFSLKNLADYLAVDRSAMFRELKHLKEEKFIEVNGRKITLLYKNL